MKPDIIGPMEGPAKGLRQKIPRFRSATYSELWMKRESDPSSIVKLTHRLASSVDVPDIAKHRSRITDRYRSKYAAEESYYQQSRQIGDQGVCDLKSCVYDIRVKEYWFPAPYLGGWPPDYRTEYVASQELPLQLLGPGRKGCTDE